MTQKNSRDVAMRYLEYGSHTAEEVRRRLTEKEFSREEIDECMEFLIDCHFVDDEKYCRRYIEFSMEKGRGPRRISQELSAKGVSKELVSTWLRQLYDSRSQREIALDQAKKALGTETLRRFDEGEVSDEASEPCLTEKELARAARRLASQGFSQIVVYDVLDCLKRKEFRAVFS